MGRKERLEVGIAREASELDPSNLDTTTEAIEPGEELEWGTPTPNSTDKGDFLPEVHSFSSYPPECSIIESGPSLVLSELATPSLKRTIHVK